MLLKEYVINNVWISSFTVFLTVLLVLGIWFHSIFKPDYRPGHSSMPFLWFPLLFSIYKKSRRYPLLSSYYTVQSLCGMVKLVEHQKILSFKFFGKVWVFLFTAENAEVVLGSSKLIEKSSDYKGFKPLLRDGLLISSGEKWRKHRKLLTPTFHFKLLQYFTPVMQDTCKTIIAQLEEMVHEPWVEVGTLMKNFSILMLLKTISGIELKISDEERKIIIDAGADFTVCSNMRMSRPWLKYDLLFRMSSLHERTYKNVNIIHSFLRRAIEDKKRKFFAARNMTSENGIKANGLISDGNSIEKENNKILKHRKPFMDLLLEQHFEDSSFTEDDILDESITFFSAGTVTIGLSISYTLYCIGLYPDVQKKIHDELDGIFQDSDRDMVEDDLRSMKYLDCVIKESLRLYSFPYMSRTATESFKVDSYTVPKGSIVVIFNYIIQRDPRYFPSPEKFDPSRFYPENSVGRHPFVYLPFSAGPRNCIGQRFALLETKTVISAILRKFRIYSLDHGEKLYDMSKIKGTERDIPVRIHFSLRDKIKEI